MERGFVLWNDTWDLREGRYTLCGVQKLIACNDTEALGRIIGGLDPSVIPNGGSLHVFREGVEPLYDHPANASGGHFKMQATSVQAAKGVWAQLTELLLADRLPRCDGVNGVTYMRTLNTRGLKLWVRDSLDKEAVKELRLFLQGLQNNQTDFVNLKFCPHKYILKTLHSQQKPLAQLISGNHRPPPTSAADSTGEAAAPTPPAPCATRPPTSTPPSQLPTVVDGAAAGYAVSHPYATPAMPGYPAFLAPLVAYLPPAVWLMYLQNLYRQQLQPPNGTLLGSYFAGVHPLPPSRAPLARPPQWTQVPSAPTPASLVLALGRLPSSLPAQAQAAE
eukprot:EG_transcript_13934